MTYLLDTLENCEAYQQAVYQAEFSGDIGTERWATPRKHPAQDLYAVPVHPDHVPEAGEVVDGLHEDWFDSAESE